MTQHGVKATQAMLDTILPYDGRYSCRNVGRFQVEVMADYGLSHDKIASGFANGYPTDEFFTAAVQTFVAAVDWEVVHVGYLASRQEVWEQYGVTPELAECIYCYNNGYLGDAASRGYVHLVTTLEVPASWDDEMWEALAEEHDPECEWIATRAHQSLIVEGICMASMVGIECEECAE